MLSKTLQRYKNKSKSQLIYGRSLEASRCLRPCKDTKIKANHNGISRVSRVYELSKTLQRYKNKSKSQRRREDTMPCKPLSKTLQRYKNKSKSQQA